MKIIIVGDGKVGGTLAEHLSHEDHDVTILDTDEAALHRSSEMLDVLCVKGNGASVSALRESGADSADLLIAATGFDEVNMVSCLGAKRMGCKYTIARIRNIEYTHDTAAMKRELDIDLVINPEYATAVEVARLLRFPDASNIETFYRGRVELLSFRAQAGDFILEKPLAALRGQMQGLPILFCAVERGSEVFIPGGDFVIEADDTVHIIGEPDGVHLFFERLGRLTAKVKSVMLVGGGRISYYLTTLLERAGLRVKLIEQDLDRCRSLAERLPRTLIIHGDGTDPALLTAEGIADIDAFIALTNRDEDNLIISLYAMQQGAGKVVAKSNRHNYAGIARSIGLDSVLSPKLITANQILQVVRAMNSSKGGVMRALYKLADGRVEALEFSVTDGAKHLGVPLMHLRLKKGILIAVIIHDNRVVIPTGGAVIAKGDSVIIITQDHAVLDFNDIYADAADVVRELFGGEGED